MFKRLIEISYYVCIPLYCEHLLEKGDWTLCMGVPPAISTYAYTVVNVGTFRGS